MNSNLIRSHKAGLYLFRAGIFLLASAPFFSFIFFLISLVIAFVNNGKKFFKDKWNYLFIIASLLMIIISLIHTLKFNNLTISEFKIDFNGIEENIINWNRFSSLIGLSNWVPFFLCFSGFQNYLLTSDDRKVAAKFFIAGVVPVLISGFGQYWFGWYGPMETLNGLIIWFQRPTGSGITSLFNNQNYAGSWLNIVWPFSLALLLEKTNNNFKKSSSIIFALFISLASFLTTSRNAWGGLLITIPLVMGPLSLFWILTLFLLLGFLLFFKTKGYLNENINELVESLLPAKFNIFYQFSSENYTNQIYNRDTIFVFALKMILKSPFIGFGAATFPIYYYMANEIYLAHTHNLIIDTAFSYGTIVTIIIFLNIVILCFLALKKIYFDLENSTFKNIYFERAWSTSFIVLLLSQMFDVQYFDGRISLSFWILLSGLRCIIKKDADTKLIKQNLELL
nr:O-antigen ligase family protein [Prochlorococcus marinus]